MFKNIDRIGDSLLFHNGDDGPCFALSGEAARGLALAIIDGADDIESTSFDNSDWPGVILNLSGGKK